MYWNLGEVAAPVVVKLCIESWRLLNREYEIIILDDNTIGEYVRLDELLPGWERLPIQKRANAIRLALLETNGGVWADATLLCTKPLRHWLPEHPNMTAVTFSGDPKSGKRVLNFFIAAPANSEFILKWSKRYFSYMKTIPRPMSRRVMKFITRNFSWVKSFYGSVLLSSKFVRDTLGFPYFVMHYLANRILIFSPRWRKLWSQSERLVAGRMSTFLVPALDEMKLRAALRDPSQLVIKLSYRTPNGKNLERMPALIAEYLAEIPND